MTFEFRSACAAAVLLAASVAVARAEPPKAEQLITWRQSAYEVLGWNTGRIKASLEGTYDKDEVGKAANVIAAIANSGLGSLFPKETDHGSGWHETRAKPELWADGSKVGDRAGDFSREANALAALVPHGDAAAVKEQFGKLTKTCKACHDDFRAKEKH